MSSPTPNTNTSIKAGLLSTTWPKVREKSSSFPFIATFNLFHKKPPASLQPSSPVQSYEVAPGIWSTDATDLETNNETTKLRIRSAGAEAPRQKAKRRPVLVRDSLGGCKQAHFGDRTEQCNTGTIRDESEASNQGRQKGNDIKGLTGGSNWSGPKRIRMRTVSRDDQLMERGANPRTGLVSPFVVSDNSEEILGGEFNTATNKVDSDGPSTGRRTRSERWKQDSFGWSLIECPLLSPIAQSMSDNMSRTLSLKHLEDRLLVEMPGVDSPDPMNMTDEQIKEHQENIAQAHKCGEGSIAMPEPDSLPSPRIWTPSPPPTKKHRIHRKEVGSGFRKSESTDTVIFKAKNGASSPPTPRKDIMKRQKVRIITPSNTPKGSSFESCVNMSNSMGKTSPFLGRESRRACSQTASATQFQSYANTGQAHQSRPNGSQSSPSSTSSDLPPACQTLSQHLHCLQYLHPSHSANPRTSSYRRPTQLRPLEQQRRAVEDACTTFITTSTKEPKGGKRPTMQRQNGNDVVPRVNHLLPGYEKPLDGHHQASTARNKQFPPSDTPVATLHTSGIAMGKSRVIRPTETPDPARDTRKKRFQGKTQTSAECFRQPPCMNRERNLTNPTRMTQELNLASANVTRERIQRSGNGDGCTTTYGHLGNEPRAGSGGTLHYISDDKEQAILPVELTIRGDSMAWFAGKWAEIEEVSERPDFMALVEEETLPHRPVLRKAADVKRLCAAEAWVERLSKLGPIQQLLHLTICHSMRKFHYASLALATLRTADATAEDRVKAMKDVALAAVYLLVLLNFLVVLIRVLVFVSRVLYWIWHPVQTILRIFRWCVLG